MSVCLNTSLVFYFFMIDKKYLFVLGFACLLFSAVLNFNETSLVSFVGFSLFMGLVSFLIIFLGLSSLDKWKEKDTKKAVYFAVPAVILVLVFVFFSFFLVGIPRAVLPAIVPAHFRTNILTGQCEFGGHSNYIKKSPWYYSEGCDLSKPELVDIIKNSDSSFVHGSVVDDCNDFCEGNATQEFCSLISQQTHSDIECYDLVDCPGITC